MISGICGIIGFIIGIVIYGSQNGGPIQEWGSHSEWSMLIPFATALLGGLIGYIIQVICNRISKKDNKNKFKVLLFTFTTILLIFFFYSLIVNWGYANIFRDGGFYLSDLPLALLKPLSILMNATLYDKNTLYIASYIGVALHLIVILIIFFYSGKGSKESEHEGKYKVTVNMNTGVEVGERKMLDPTMEALKKNIIISLVFIIACTVLPFISFSYGYYLCFEKQLYKNDKRWWISIVFTASLTLFFYIVLFVVTAILCQ